MDEDEEEILVYVEFENCNENNTFSNKNLKLDMIGIDTEHPIMQVNGKFYEGTYEDAVGTYMFFEREKKKPIEDEFETTPNLKYVAKTRKLLRMERIFVATKNQSDETNVDNDEEIDSSNFEDLEHQDQQRASAAK